MSAPQHQPVQLRIGFQRPTSPVVLDLTLSGLLVLADAPNGHYDEAWQHLSACGVSASVHEGGGLTFPVSQLSRLVDLPADATVRADPVLAPLWALASHPPADGLPATLERDPSGDLHLAWYDGSFRHDQLCDPAMAPALLASEMSFVGTAAAWEVLKERSLLPVLAGRCRLNLDGFVEITTTKPQLVEAAPLPGLFRIDDTHFGVALAHAQSVIDSPGFTWEGHLPSGSKGPVPVGELGVTLSAHARADVAELAGQLSSYGSASVVWDSGLGRRVMVLAAMEVLDAWPLLIVSPPSSVWLWQRHLEMLGRSGALTNDEADARIVTYLDLARGVPIEDPSAIIFDDLVGQEAGSAQARAACRRLDGVHDAYRVAVADRWPDDLSQQVSVMSVLRPGEFRSDVPVELRYPIHTAERVGEHVGAYLMRRQRDDPGTDLSDFRRSSVELVEPSEDQRRDLAALSAQPPTPTALTAALELVSVGSDAAPSPKLARCIAAVGAAAAKGHRVAVVTRHRRAATLLRALVRPHKVAVVEESGGQLALDCVDDDVAVVVVRFDRFLPNLRSFHTVVVLDYPWSAATLDAAVGPQEAHDGPSTVKVLHLAATVDDRLAMLSAVKRERGGDAEASGPSAEEVAYLLAPRWSIPRS